MTSGYRIDCIRVPNPVTVMNILRIFRYDAGALTQLGSSVALNGTYYDANDNRAVTFNAAMTGTTLTGWLSASGQSDSPTITATAPGTNSYPSGRLGWLSFSNAGGIPGPIGWRSLTSTWTT
jgi:hypothetical protein